MKADRERTLILAHQTAALSSLAMAGKLKPVEHYLKPKKPKGEGNAAVLAMMRRMAKKKKGVSDG